MKKEKPKSRKYKAIEIYAILLVIAALFMSLAYAKITDIEVTITGDVESEVQTGVFITDVTTTDENSSVNFYIGTMLDSTTVIFGRVPVTYQITIHNNSNSEYVYIGALTDETDETLYSNISIEYTVNGITKGETTIGPNEDLTFTITFEYIGVTGGANILDSKINFRFKEKPVLELSNEGATYTLENIYAGYTEQEYEFTVTNFSGTNINTVPMTYSFETEIDTPLTLKIYDENGAEVTESIEIEGDGTTKTTQTYTAKVIWDSSLDSEEYEGQEYIGTVALKATPTDTKYLDYTITKAFNIDITTCSHEYEGGICTICGYVCSPHTWDNGTCTKCGIICIHNYVDETCTICGFEAGVYAILYSDGDLHFNTTGRLDETKTEAGNTVLMQSENIKSLAMTAATSQPWASNRTSVTTVTIEEEIKPKNNAYWFYGCSKLTTINNISNLNTANVTNMNQMFRNCSALTVLDVTKFKTENVTNMYGMFYGCSSLTTLDVTSFNTSKVTNMEEMFTNCSALTTLDLTNWDVSKVTSMYNMFCNCGNIQSIYLGEFNAINVTHVGNMFRACTNLSTLDTSNFSTSSKLTSTYYMFQQCKNIQTLDLSKFNTSNVSNMKYMFYGCEKLSEVNLSSFNTAKVTDMQYMFCQCTSLATLDLSNFTAEKLTNTYAMFSEATSLQTIYLSNFNTALVTNMNAMFYDCPSLTLLDIRQATFDAVTSYTSMFINVNTNIKVIVKDAGEETNVPKTWIKERLGAYGTVYTVTEWQAAGGE